MSVLPPIIVSGNGSRQCGECKACCQGWLAGSIRGHAMRPGVPCHFLDQTGCNIYAERPASPCRSFICGWLAPESPFPEDFRPDGLGVVIVRIQWRDHPAYLLVSAGRDPDERLLAWMREFAIRTSHPFFYQQNGEKLAFGPAEFQRDMLTRLERGEPMW